MVAEFGVSPIFSWASNVWDTSRDNFWIRETLGSPSAVEHQTELSLQELRGAQLAMSGQRPRLVGSAEIELTRITVRSEVSLTPGRWRSRCQTTG